LLAYFSDPAWNFSIALALLGGANMHEIDEICRPLKEKPISNSDKDQEAWLESWASLGRRLEGLAQVDERAGNYLSAGRKYLSACNYYIIAERQVSHLNPQKPLTYTKVLQLFRKGVQLGREPVEFVEIPYQNTSLPALFIPAQGNEKAPCMIHFNGADSIKELLYFVNNTQYRRRGISLLIVDNPGAGESLRLRNLYTGPETEIPAAACVDYLEKRIDVDPNRIGIVALSLGGYYAPRAAAFEKRLKCCVAWGASWDLFYLVDKLASGELQNEHLINFQFAWITGTKTVEELLSVARKMTLEGVAEKITCPLLVVHGEKDRLLPISIAEKTIAAAKNSQIRKLKIFTQAEGGVEHCQADDGPLAVEYISDWVASILGGNPKGV
jgi:pimeloyl-ACP methyl ester carboxylesterase